jgi:thiol-disulfide isomerase/thioredoxin
MKPPLKHLVIAAALLVFSQAGAEDPTAGSPLPELQSLLPGARLPDTAGKVVLVDFWASWCEPCRASFPALQRLHQKYAARGLVVVGIGVDEEADAFQAFAKRQRVGFSLVHDAGQKAVARFNPATMPTSYLVDRKGKIRHVHRGFQAGGTEAEYVREIEALLAE